MSQSNLCPQKKYHANSTKLAGEQTENQCKRLKSIENPLNPNPIQADMHTEIKLRLFN